MTRLRMVGVGSAALAVATLTLTACTSGPAESNATVRPPSGASTMTESKPAPQGNSPAAPGSSATVGSSVAATSSGAAAGASGSTSAACADAAQVTVVNNQLRAAGSDIVKVRAALGELVDAATRFARDAPADVRPDATKLVPVVEAFRDAADHARSTADLTKRQKTDPTLSKQAAAVGFGDVAIVGWAKSHCK